MNLQEYVNQAKKLEKKTNMKEANVAILSNFTTLGLGNVIKFFAHKQNIWVQEYTADYNQYAQEIINAKSKLNTFNPDMVFLILNFENLFGEFVFFPYRLTPQERITLIEEKFNEIKSLIDILLKNPKIKVVLNNMPIPRYSSRGIIEHKQEKGLRESVRKFNTLLLSLAVDSRIFIFDMEAFYSQLGYEQILDSKMDYMGDMKISPYGLVRLGEEFTGYLYPLTSTTKKCLVLDMDNTLWGGVIGEDGIDGIQLGPEKSGKPFFDFQQRILELFERGVILAINSKNNYDDVKEVFEKHKYMLLKEDHFACIKANWQDKATNMKEIAQEINIGLDSIVFLDDDETNRAIVRKMTPEVTVIDLPKDFSEYPKVIEELKLFNTFSITQEDLKKGEMYAHQKKRAALQSKVTNIEDFIKQLNVKIQTIQVTSAQVGRISQLTQKTNQFNVTTKRYQQEEIESFIKSGALITCVAVTDRFGDYGITGVFIVVKHDTYWDIDTFLLSCRVLGKTVEFALMQNLLEFAKKDGVSEIRATFIPTKKNVPAKDFFIECGFELVKTEGHKQHYTIDVNKFKKKQLHVEVI